MLSPLEGHWKMETSFPQTPNQCQSNHTGFELYCARSTVEYRCGEKWLVRSTYSQAGGGEGGLPLRDRWGVCIHECPVKISLDPPEWGRGLWKGPPKDGTLNGSHVPT